MADTKLTGLKVPEFKEILTPRLRLRTVRVSDAERLLPLITNDEVMRWTSHGAVSNIDQAQKWLSARALGPHVFNFAIELRHDDTGASVPDSVIIGLAGSFHPPEIGYMVHPDYSGQGYATEAIQAIIPQFFEQLPPASEGGVGSDHIEGWTDVQNHASQKILVKCGFTTCETVPDPENQLRGPTATLIFRKARPGTSLDELGLLASKESKPDDAPTPPVQ